MTLPFYDADTVYRTLGYDTAMDALESALRGGLDPEAGGPRLFAEAPGGEFLIMPAAGGAYSGVKVLTSAPENPARGLAKIQGVYVLFASDTLTPLALVEGASLTVIRTSAVTISAVRLLAAQAAGTGADVGQAPNIVVFGAGLQAAGHIRAAHLAFPAARFSVVGRAPARVAELRADLAGDGIEVTDRSGQAAGAVANAQIIVCVTTATTPVFDSTHVAPGTIVAAAGTHGRERRELDDALIARSDVVVEGRASARAENGNLVSLAEADWQRVGNLRELARGEFRRDPKRPVVYTGVGMSWQDLVLAAALHGRHA